MEKTGDEKVDLFITLSYSAIAIVTGSIGLLASEIDLLLAILLKIASLLATILVMAVNYEKGIKQIKKWFGK